MQKPTFNFSVSKPAVLGQNRHSVRKTTLPAVEKLMTGNCCHYYDPPLDLPLNLYFSIGKLSWLKKAAEGELTTIHLLTFVCICGMHATPCACVHTHEGMPWARVKRPYCQTNTNFCFRSK